MSKLNCELIVYANTGHVQQLLTGYFLLKQQERINLIFSTERVEFDDLKKPQHIRDAKKYHLKVILDNRIVIYYDIHDSYEIDEDELSNVDIYFKRSYSRPNINLLNIAQANKIFELGYNYWVYPNSIDFDNIKRSLFFSNGKARLSSFARALNLPSFLTNAPKLKDVEALPILDDKIDKKILFMARTWNPYDQNERSAEKIEERKEINETRALCIRALKKEFGNSFSGGFSQTQYTLDNYKDCVFPDTSLTTKKKYLDFLKQHSICITTTGLHGSTGWKFGEYVAMSKAIVSEKLVYSVPGTFEKNSNYLEFTTPQECVEQTLLLYNDNEKRHEMMLQNAKYYNQYLKPDVLVYNSILKALELYYR